jgi:hypothetical protein
MHILPQEGFQRGHGADGGVDPFVRTALIGSDTDQIPILLIY